MKAVILAGGFGTRLSEETQLKPKPMVEIGGKPILWHIMKLYACHGICDFVICAGYRAYLIKEYFANYSLHMSDVTWDFRAGCVEIHHRRIEPWRVTLVDTGNDTNTGGRLKRIQGYIGNETFLMTYGDAVGDVAIADSIAFHRAHGRLATVTAVRPPGRFGRLSLATGDQVLAFCEKPDGDGDWINGGFFVLEPGIFELIDGDQTVWEGEPLERLVGDGQLQAFRHYRFWRPMDTLRDKQQLEALWSTGNAPWKLWDEHAPAEHVSQPLSALDDRIRERTTAMAGERTGAVDGTPASQEARAA